MTKKAEKTEDFVLEDWLQEGLRGLRIMRKDRERRLRKATGEYRKHLKTAGKETLMAMRSLLDAAIEEFEAPEEEPESQKIEVE